MSSLENSGVRPLAISVDTPEESSNLCKKAGLTFPLLSDRDTRVTRLYDLLLKKAGKDDRDISGIAEFLVDTTGHVRWRRLSEAGPETFIAAAKALN